MAYVSYFEKYKKYYDSLFGQEGIVGKSQSLSNDVSNRINIIKNSYFNMINESKWQELGKNIVATQIISGLKSEINKLNIFIKNNLCKACDLAINIVLANLEIIKVEDENLKKMYDDLTALLDEYNRTPQYNDNWRDEKDSKGKITSVYYRTDNPRYNELRIAINNQNLDIDSKETYIKRLCNEVNNAIRTIVELNISDILNSGDIVDVFSGIELEDFNMEPEDAVFLEGDELSKFLSYNNIPVEDTVVEKTGATVNGVFFPVYYVYDINCIKQETQSFKEFSEDSLNKAASIDSKILKYISGGGTSIIFEQTKYCDNFSISKGDYVGAAYYWRPSKNITVYYPPDESAYDYYSKSIIHEFGHAYDHKLGNLLYMTSIDSIRFIGGLFGSYTWAQLIEKDGANMLNASGEKFSYYKLNDFRDSNTEYFAEAFKDYYVSHDTNARLAFIAPDTYKAMESLINKTISEVN